MARVKANAIVEGSLELLANSLEARRRGMKAQGLTIKSAFSSSFGCLLAEEGQRGRVWIAQWQCICRCDEIEKDFLTGDLP